MRWKVSATTLFAGPRINDGYTLGIITGDRSLTDQAWTRGEYMRPHSVGGTEFDRPEMYLSVPAGGQMDCAVIKESVTSKMLCEFGGPGLRQKLDDINICVMSPEYWGRFEKAVEHRLLNPVPDLDESLADRLIVLIAEMLQDSVESELLKDLRLNRWDVVRDVIDFAHELPPGQPPTVKHLMQVKRREDDTIARAVKEQFGIKPLELMRVICLEKARTLLMYPELRVQEGLTTIASVHRHFGWVKGDKFAAQYQKHFGVKPSDDLESAN